jgi:hypothetical protein
MRAHAPAYRVAETRNAQRPRRNDDAVIAQYIQDLSRAS